MKSGERTVFPRFAMVALATLQSLKPLKLKPLKLKPLWIKICVPVLSAEVHGRRAEAAGVRGRGTIRCFHTLPRARGGCCIHFMPA